MARGGAGILPGSVYHLISRFVAKEWFIEAAVERRMYVSLLGGAIEASDWRLFCYAVMSSHIHLGVVAGNEPLRSWMRPMHTVFANWLNVRRERIGAVFVRGPNVIQPSPNQVARLIRYVHCNPVRAGVVSHASASDWTSQRAYLGVARRPSWLDVECGAALAGMTAVDLARWSETSDDRDASSLSPKRGRGRPRHSPAPGTVATSAAVRRTFELAAPDMAATSAALTRTFELAVTAR